MAIVAGVAACGNGSAIVLHPAGSLSSASLWSSLPAPGVLAALERRRRKQAWRRPPGRQVVTPQPDAAWAEVALRLGEDETAAWMLDVGLRYLGIALQREGRTPPTVFAAHIGEDNLDLWVTPPGLDVPAPC